ncbi:MAG: lipoyl(octanoyl) transferase LipB [Myxococcales bacterium]|nr:lipoyl(octanoyl) transferase LipB [Myxococcales bacterium]MBK7196609.1 lipoyl(octanoyl) transferase LipB [Myxococcales bacterium]MBP6845572.1 lipoyl(octanoyl) transferase LipB [Kofleriaceae bacterium]
MIAWRWLGRVGHADAVALQEAHRQAIHAGDADAAVVLLCEHPPVITLGQSADRGHVLIDDDEAARRGVTITKASRGGDVTYHGPGQLMVYPVVRVRSVVAFLERVAGALAAECAAVGVDGARFERDPAGLWLGPAKLAACGLHLARGVAIHGWAWNVATPPAAWSAIVPCGLAVPQMSLAEACAARGLPPPPPLDELAARLGPRLVAALEP